MTFGFIFPGRVAKIIDGDTLDVVVERTIRIRLLDCWAPETRGAERPEGLVAKKFLRAIAAKGAEVSVSVPIEQDERFGEAMTFGRILGRVTLEAEPDAPPVSPVSGDAIVCPAGSDLSALMVAHGMATERKAKKKPAD
jgi:endonuclease YncB( thermonuclease family)